MFNFKKDDIIKYIKAKNIKVNKTNINNEDFSDDLITSKFAKKKTLILIMKIFTIIYYLKIMLLIKIKKNKLGKGHLSRIY